MCQNTNQWKRQDLLLHKSSSEWKNGCRACVCSSSPAAGWGAGGSGPVCWKPPGSTSAAPPARPLSALHPAVSSSGSDPLQTLSARQCALCSGWSPSGNSARRVVIKHACWKQEGANSICNGALGNELKASKIYYIINILYYKSNRKRYFIQKNENKKMIWGEFFLTQWARLTVSMCERVQLR